jgi:sugar lactone lactonase YvrE
MSRFALVAAGFLGLLAGASAPAPAHEDPTLDLQPLVDLVGARIAATADGDPKVHRAWVALGRAVTRPLPEGLAADVGKVSAAARTSIRKFPLDTALKNLVAGLTAEIEDILEDLPEESEAAIDRVEPQRRRSLERAAVKARLRFLAGREAGAGGDALKRLSLWKKAAAGFVSVDDRAHRFVDRQGGSYASTFPGTAGAVYTMAGTGNGGFNGDGRSARRTQLYWVEEVKFGPDGLLYVLDWNNHMVRRIESDGTFSRLIGKGAPGDSEGDPLETELNHPSAVDFDAEGRVYVAAWHNHKVKVWDPTGASPVVYTIAGGPQGNSGDGGPATDALFNLVPGVLLLPEGHPLGGGDLLATDAGNQCVRVIRLASDPVTDVNVAGVEVGTGTVDRIFGTGVQGHDGDGQPAIDARLGFSKAQNAESDGRMTLGPDGSVYIVSGVEHVVRRVLPDGTITTVAGDGTAGFSGDGGSAVEAQLNFPADVAVAADGTVYISDQFNHCIRRVDPAGDISTFAGTPGVSGYSGDGGPAASATFFRPSGLELDAAGNLWVCDKNNSVIRMVLAVQGAPVPRDPYRLPIARLGAPPRKGPAGTIDTFAGTGSASFNGDGEPARETDFYWPQDVSVNPVSGLLYVVDWNNHRIRRVDDDGTVATIVGVGELGDTYGPAHLARMNHPTDVSFHPITGDLHVATWHTDKVKRVVGATNELVAVNKFDGKRTFSGEDGPVSMAELNLPSSMKFDSAGNMFIADAGNRRVRRVDLATQIIDTVVGTGAAGYTGDGDLGTLATLNLPVGQSAQPAGRICVDPTDTWVYIADTDNHVIRRLHVSSGIITTYAGNGVRAFAGDGLDRLQASFASPVDVDCDAAGNLFVCDRDNHAIRRVDFATGVVTTVAGTGDAPGYVGDGGPATSARLFLPGGVFVDRASGRLFIADTFNSVVRVVWEE